MPRMPHRPISDAELSRFVDLVKKHGSRSAAAAALGRGPSAYAYHIRLRPRIARAVDDALSEHRRLREERWA